MSIYGLLIESRVDIVRRKFPNLSDNEVNQIIATDPTETKKFILWIAREYDRISGMSFDKVKNLLINWEQQINRLNFDMLADYNIHHGLDVGTHPNPSNYKDIYTYTLRDVAELVPYLQKLPTKNELKTIARSETTKIYEGPLDGYNVLIVQPLSYRASCHYGATTKWCTASKTTTSNFDSYTKRGNLYYIIFKDENYKDKEDGKPQFKYALFFEEGAENPQIFNEQDKTVPPDKFFEEFPTIRKLFRDHFPMNPYEIFQQFKKNPDINQIQMRQIFNTLAKYAEDKYVSIEEHDLPLLKQGKIKLYIDNDCLEKLFISEESSGGLYQALSSSSYYEPIYQYDSYQSSEDFQNGYIFRHFSIEVWEKLLEYFKMSDTQAMLIVNKIIKLEGKEGGWERLEKLYSKLADLMGKPRHSDLRDDIQEEYGMAMEEAVNVDGDDAVLKELNDQFKSFFESICQDPVDVINYHEVNVSIDDILRWYQNGDVPLPEGSSRVYEPISKFLFEKNEDGYYGFGDSIYEFYYDGYDEDTFNSEFKVIPLIDRQIERLESDPDIQLNMEKTETEIEKLESVGIYIGETYRTPDQQYKIYIGEIDTENTLFLITVKDLVNDKIKRAWVTAERIINLLNIRPMFDLIDEIHTLFNKILK